jgi:nucleoid-associated protein YgaU
VNAYALLIEGIMLMLLRRLFFLTCTVLLLVTGIARQSSYAQTGANTCSSLVQQAIAALGTNCEGLGRNSACYGTFRVNATFSDPEVEASFSAPADRAPINTLQTIRTAPLNTETNEWGVALISAQANLPGVLPGQNALFLLIGDAEIENAVPEDEAFESGEPLHLLAHTETSLYEYPGSNADVLDVISAGAELLTDAVSPNGQWLRTAYNDLAGWVSSDAVTSEEDLSSLPVYGEMSFTPMQAFYFRTNVGTECSEAPSAVVVQGPENLTIDINANGADVRLGSTVLFRTLPLDDTEGLPDDAGSLFQIIVLDGEAILNPDSDNPIIVPAGYTTVACLSNPQDLGTDGVSNDMIVLADCGFTPPRPLTEEEWAEFTTLNDVSLNYEMDIEEYLEEECVPDTSWTNTYTVQSGDALSLIAEMFDTTAGAIAAANCIENPDIVSVGQVLRVPQPIEPTEAPTPTPEPTQPQQAPPPDQPPPAQPTATPVEEETPPVEPTPEETEFPEETPGQ